MDDGRQKSGVLLAIGMEFSNEQGTFVHREETRETDLARICQVGMNSIN